MPSDFRGTSIASRSKYKAAPDLDSHLLGDNRELIYSPVNGAKSILSKQESLILSGCSTFDELENHSARLTKQFYMKPKELTEKLETLVAAGLLVSESDLVDSCCATTNETSSVEKISSLGIPTRNRPNKLETGLRSFVQKASENGREIRFIVADGSDTEETIQANIAVLSSLKKEFGAEFEYIGSAERERFIAELADEADVPQEVVRFAVQNDEGCPLDFGCNRNSLLLATVGEMTVQVDDDIVCLISQIPERRNGLKLTTKETHYELFLPDEDSHVTDARIDSSTDFYSLHESMLGKSLRECIETLSDGALDMGTIRSTFSRRFGQGGGGTVQISTMGVHGDSGLGTVFPLLLTKGESYKRLVASKEKYDFAMQTHHIRRAVGECTITDTASFASYNLGIDNRRLIPPFLPVQRGEDIIFGTLLRMSGEGYFGFLPWTVTHIRPERWKQNPEGNATRISFSQILNGFMNTVRAHKCSGTARNFKAIGEELMQIGRLPFADFEENSRLVVWARARSRMEQLERVKKEVQSDVDFWLRDMDGFMQRLRNSMPRRDFSYPYDLCDAFGEEQGRILAQRLVRRFGELLSAWEELRNASQRLNERGVSFGRRITND